MKTHKPLFLNLGLLATRKPLWLDTDGDGYADQLRIGLRVAPDLGDGLIWATLCNLAGRLAMQVICLSNRLISVSRQPASNSLL
jgi:hypothetical protein